MTTSWTLAAPTSALRDWLRGAGLSVDARVYAGGLPADATLPAVVLHRVSGTFDGPIDVGVYQVDCWAATGPAAETLAYEVASLLVSTAPTDVGAVRVAGTVVESVAAVPDPDDPDVYRYTVAAQVSTVPAP